MSYVLKIDDKFGIIYIDYMGLSIFKDIDDIWDIYMGFIVKIDDLIIDDMS